MGVKSVKSAKAKATAAVKSRKNTPPEKMSLPDLVMAILFERMKVATKLRRAAKEGTRTRPSLRLKTLETEAQRRIPRFQSEAVEAVIS